MKYSFKSEHWNDGDGNPDGGTSFGNGFAISWQRGLGKGEPNGACVEDVLHAVRDRIRYYQSSPSSDYYYVKALRYIDSALLALYLRMENES
jgi:hypothetical protein